jgi:hypothetical protein
VAFDQAKADEICARLSKGETVSEIARQLQIGRTTIHDWRAENPQFFEQFARAKDEGYDAIADSVFEIADDGKRDYVVGEDGVYLDRDHIQRSKLRVETRLKLLAKWDPKRYGDKMQHEGDLKIEVVIHDPAKQLRK